jgi:cobalt-zinc-cadmium efflux system membrane fusion protein
MMPTFSIRNLWCLTLVGVSLLSLSACDSSAVKPPQIPGEAQKVDASNGNEGNLLTLSPLQVENLEFKTAESIEGHTPVWMSLTGVIQAIPNQTLHIGTPVAGRIERISVNLEELVHPQDTLVTLYSKEIGDTQTELLNTLLDLEATELQVETDKQFATSSFEREKRLFEGKVSAKADYEMAQTNLKKITRQLSSIRQKRHALIDVYDKRLQLMGAALGSAYQVASGKTLQPRVYLKSLKRGIVTTRNANPGEWVEANTEILTIADLSQVWVVAQAFEKDLIRLHAGQAVKIQLDGRPNEHLTGKITIIGSEVHPDTRTADVRIQVQNAKQWLKPNLFARVSIEVGQQTGILIPKTAVQSFGDRKVVYVQSSTRQFRQNKVTVLGEASDRLVAVQGLREHQKVVTDGSFAIHGEWL